MCDYLVDQQQHAARTLKCTTTEEIYLGSPNLRWTLIKDSTSLVFIKPEKPSQLAFILRSLFASTSAWGYDVLGVARTWTRWPAGRKVVWPKIGWATPDSGACWCRPIAAFGILRPDLLIRLEKTFTIHTVGVFNLRSWTEPEQRLILAGFSMINNGRWCEPAPPKHIFAYAAPWRRIIE